MGVLIYPIVNPPDCGAEAYLSISKRIENIESEINSATAEAKPELEEQKNAAQEELNFVKTNMILTASDKSMETALETIKTLTTVFGPWIAALVAFYFAGKQLETVSEQLGEAQKNIRASDKPNGKRILEGKLVKDIMILFDPKKHVIQSSDPKLKIDSKIVLNNEVINAITDHANKYKDVRCFVVYDPDGKFAGIITPTDINEILEDPTKSTGKLLEDFITRKKLVKGLPTQSLADIHAGLTNYKVVPVFEDEDKIVGFVYKDDVYKLVSET